MKPASSGCTLATIAGLLFIGAVRLTFQVLPPSFVRPEPKIFHARSAIRFNVRVVPHPDLRRLRAEAWDLAPVPWSYSFPFGDDAPMRWEPIGSQPVRASEEPLEYQPIREGESYQAWRDRISPRTLYEIKWNEGILTPGHAELVIRVITARGVSVKATRRVTVL